MWTDRASSGSSSSTGRVSGRFKHWIWGRFGAASGAANAFQWDQFDAPDDAAGAGAVAAAAAAVARCVHSLRPKFYTHSWRKRRSKNGATKRRENPPNPNLWVFLWPIGFVDFTVVFLWISLDWSKTMRREFTFWHLEHFKANLVSFSANRSLWTILIC